MIVVGERPRRMKGGVGDPRAAVAAPSGTLTLARGSAPIAAVRSRAGPVAAAIPCSRRGDDRRRVAGLWENSGEAGGVAARASTRAPGRG